MNRRRLELEPMRDTLLAVSGAIDLKIGGRPQDILEQPFKPRRTIYGFIDRQNLPGMFRTFDLATPDSTSPQRFNTTVPQQALFMMNGPFVVEQTRHLLERPEVKNAGSLTTNNSKNGRFINNIAVAWKSDQPPYEQKNPNSDILYYSDLYFGAPNNFVYSDPSQLIEADLLFVYAPVLDLKLPSQHASVPHPSQIGNGLALSPSSPAIGRGIDPTALPKLPKNIITDLRKYVYTDIDGNKRRRGGPFDLGAYQSCRLFK